MSESETEAELRERLERTEAALEEALAERARLWDDANRRRAAEHELEEVRRMVVTMTASPSWRVTAPLRRAKVIAGRQRHIVRRGLRVLRGG